MLDASYYARYTPITVYLCMRVHAYRYTMPQYAGHVASRAECNHNRRRTRACVQEALNIGCPGTRGTILRAAFPRMQFIRRGATRPRKKEARSREDEM